MKFEICSLELSVVVTHHRDVENLKKCLNALEKELAGQDAEIIVILSEFQIKAFEFFKKEFVKVKFLPFEKNLYFVRSANRGLEKAQGNYILIINDDVIISSGAIAQLIDFLKNNPRAGLVGPKVLYPDNSEQPSCFRFYTPMTVVCRRTFLGRMGFCKSINDKFLYHDKNFNSSKWFRADWLMNGAGVMTKKECLDKAGLLDERFKHYFSDVDWCRRFWKNGYEVAYFPEVVFYHYHGKRSGNGGALSLFANKLARIHLIDGIRYFWKWGIKDFKR